MEEKKNGRVFSGVVVSAKMKNTVVVAVNRLVQHPKYKKYFKVTKRLKAHDEGNTKKEGDRVTIVMCRPLSKDKHFRVLTSERSEEV